MSLKKLIKGVLPELSKTSIVSEAKLLHEIPTETLYYAIKAADAQDVMWLFENAKPSQIQGLIDLDCWSGDTFMPDRFLNFFRYITKSNTKTILRLSKNLDPEIIVRGLMEYCEVFDHDPQEPLQVPEKNLLISIDQRYAIVISHPDENFKEDLFQWINMLSVEDIDLMRRHLESCKWEQKSDLEEFGYRIKKARLEELGFVDKEEALEIYAVGKTAEIKTQLLSNPIKKFFNEKDSVHFPEETESLLPKVFDFESFSETKFLSKAFAQISDKIHSQIISQELIRTFHASLMADEALHNDVDWITFVINRSRNYVNIGLIYLSGADVDAATDILKTQKTMQIARIGWLLCHDISRTARAITAKKVDDILPLEEEAFLASFNDRHIDVTQWSVTGPTEFSTDTKNNIELNIENLTKAAEKLTQINDLCDYLHTELKVSLDIGKRKFSDSESAITRLLTGAFREACNAKFSTIGLNRKNWDSMSAQFSADKLDKTTALIVSKCPANAQKMLGHYLNEYSEGLKDYMSKEASFPANDDGFAFLTIDRESDESLN